MECLVGVCMLFAHALKQFITRKVHAFQRGIHIDRPKAQTLIAPKDDPAKIIIDTVSHQYPDYSLICGRVPLKFFKDHDRVRIADVGRECVEAKLGNSYYVAWRGLLDVN